MECSTKHLFKLMNTTRIWDNQVDTKRQNKYYSLEAQMNTRLEAHKCGLGTLTREALGTIGSGPNSTPSLNRVDETTDTRGKSKKYGKTENIW